MAKETLEQLINKRSEEYQGKIRIAVIGNVKSGKTIVSALLKYTLTKLWIPKTNGKWESITSSGQNEINEIIREMKKGRFASPTSNTTYPKLILDIFRMEGEPTKIELILHDMSGENYSDLLTSSSYSNIDDRLVDILSGDGAYLAFAKKYVIVIDCEEKDEWDTDIANVALMISKIREIKQKIRNYDSDELIHSPIAIVFTKSDLLSSVDQEKSAEELAKEYPELVSSLRINHDQNFLQFFKVYVSSCIETPEEAEKRIKKNKEEVQKEYERELKTWNEQIESAIQQAVSNAEIQAAQERLDEEETRDKIENTKQQIKKEYMQQFDQKHPMKDQEEYEAKSKVEIPLKYSESEYMQFISWILDKKNE